MAGRIWTFAIDEFRASVRLTRTWGVVFLPTCLGLLPFLAYSRHHDLYSSVSATLGGVAPRFLVNSFGSFIVLGLLAGVTLLVFDRRHRDETAGIAAALDSRPFTNFELVSGRLLGLLAVTWGTVVAVALLVQVAGFVSESFGWWLQPLEPASLLSFVFIESLATLLFWCALVQLIAATVANRLVVLSLAGLVFVLHLWSLNNVPIYLQPALSMQPGFGQFSSDLVPYRVDLPMIVHHASTTVLALAFLALASVAYQRLESRRLAAKVAAGAVLAIVGSGGLGVLALNAVEARTLRHDWRQAQEDLVTHPVPDIERVSGIVTIRPGRHLELDLVLAVEPPETDRQSMDAAHTKHVGERTPIGSSSGEPRALVFSFNPGMEIDSLTMDGQPVDYRHENGVLRIEGHKPWESGESHMMAITAQGIPDPDFAYLDSAIDAYGLSRLNSSMSNLGTVASIFDSDYVALMPAARWLPSSGPNLSTDHPLVGRDYFLMDIEVEIPTQWQVVGPGAKEELALPTTATSGLRRVRLHSSAPLPQVALVASRFERRALSVSGIEMELLVSPKHAGNLRVFAGLGEYLKPVLERHFGDASAVGLDYPYGTLSLVEVPTRLRGYGGGWSMDTVLSQPGVLLLREQGFPTARFRGRVKAPLVEDVVYDLRHYFNNDRSGGNVVAGIARDFVRFQTGGDGAAGPAIDFVLDDLAGQILVYTTGFFTAHLFGPTDEARSGSIRDIVDIAMGNTASVYGETGWEVESPSTWERALETPLRNLDSLDSPREALNVLALRGWRIARTLRDVVGPVRIGEFLAALRRDYVGRSIGPDDLQDLALDMGFPLEGTNGLGLNDVEMPGFLASEAAVWRITEDERGSPRFQIKLHVRNDLPPSGWFRVRVLFDGRRPGGPPQNRLSDPVRVNGDSSVEIGLVYQMPPREVWLVPYLSRNRREVRLDVAAYDEELIVDIDPFSGVRSSDWLPESEIGIVVDDLDLGFSIRQGGGEKPKTDWSGLPLDNGIPVHGVLADGRVPIWTRQELPSSWGKYRHTIVRASPGDQGLSAIFSAHLPTPGRWSLSYHVPHVTQLAVVALGSRFPGRYVRSIGTLGSFEVVVATDSTEVGFRFDGRSSEAGWNSLGTFDLEAGRVDVGVSTRSDGDLVLADAIRWVPDHARLRDVRPTSGKSG